MTKRISPHHMAALLLCILFCMALSMYLSGVAFAFGDDADSAACTGEASAQGITVDITQPSACTADSTEVGYCITDAAGNGFASAKIKVGTDGEWKDVTDCLERWEDRYTGRIRITDNCLIAVRVTGHDGSVYEKMCYIDCFAQGTHIFLTDGMLENTGGDKDAGKTNSASTDKSKNNAPAVEPTSASGSNDAEPDTAPRSPVALTPDGQGSVVDDVTDTGRKEFFTISTKDDNTFYLVIDRERESENVYLLDTVKESDLLSLAEKDAGQDTPGVSAIPDPEPVCTCLDKCAPGEVNTSCPVCVLSLKDCTGRAPAAAPEPDPEPEKGGNTVVILAVIAVLAVGGAGYYLKIYKPKHDLDSADDFDDLTGGDEETINEDDVEPALHRDPYAEPEYPEGFGYTEPGDEE